MVLKPYEDKQISEFFLDLFEDNYNNLKIKHGTLYSSWILKRGINKDNNS